MMLINNLFEIGQSVYLKTDKDQERRMVTAFSVNAGNVIRYSLGFGASQSWHDEFEISAEKDILINAQ